jgi:hypothetical protein
MIDFIPGTVTVASPLEVRLDGEVEAARTSMVGVWTPAVDMRVLVVLRAGRRLYALGPITA